jgi:hypothetical protein
MLGPGVAPGETAFKLEYSGADTLRLLVPHTAGDYDFVMTWASFAGVLQDGGEDEVQGWLPLPSRTAGADTLAFPVFLGGAGAKEGGPSLARFWPRVTTFKRISFAQGTSRGQMAQMYEQNIRDALTSLINAIPPGRRAGFQQRANVSLQPSVYVDSVGAIQNPPPAKYVPFWDYTALLPRCIFMMTDRSAASMAHEVGHYAHHVLLDNYGYGFFARNTRPSQHHVGQPGCRNNLIEEPAYFTDYYLTGRADRQDPEHGTFAVRNGTVWMNPATSDIPDLEGFTTAMFASVTRTNPQIFNYERTQVVVPVVTGTRESLFQGCYEIIARGTDSVIDARDRLEGFLGSIQQADKLPIMLQAIGWSYHGRARLIDTSGSTIINATARPLAKAGGVEYLLKPAVPPSGTNDFYTFPELFPMQNTIRVWVGRDSVDVVVANPIPWSTTTPTEQNLGDLIVNPASNLLPLLVPMQGVWTENRSWVRTTTGGLDGGDYAVYNTEDYRPECPPLTWNGTRFLYVRDRSAGTSPRVAELDSLYGEVAPDTRTLRSITFLAELTNWHGQTASSHFLYRMTLRDVPLFGHPRDGLGLDMFTYRLMANEVADKVVNIYLLMDYEGHHIEGRVFDHTERGILIRFKAYPGQP